MWIMYPLTVYNAIASTDLFIFATTTENDDGGRIKRLIDTKHDNI